MIEQHASRSTTPSADVFSHSVAQCITSSSITAPSQDKPYKPKFHKAALYQSATNSDNNSATISVLDINNTKNNSRMIIQMNSSLKEKHKEDELHLIPQHQLLVMKYLSFFALISRALIK